MKKIANIRTNSFYDDGMHYYVKNNSSVIICKFGRDDSILESLKSDVAKYDTLITSGGQC